ncbi:ACP S-malonyltransferase [Gorillibacterium sp. sgz500922]|uniref:ACP S-malonyltransferase n=1 Tax=Gorillibacterium sp. sgz500922 TaxID=3446694 RepID=UPI003F666018
MGKLAYIFPGQGAQTVGMGRDAWEASDQARRVFAEADQALGFGLSELIFSGPEDVLKQTVHTQPALVTVSTAYLEVLRAKGFPEPDFVAGHSLGEYSALVASGVFSFSDAVRTVRRRGELMEEAVPNGLGAMAAVLGAEREALAALCREITDGGRTVELANVNCPGQIVVSGTKEGVEAVQERGKEIGAKRVLPLEVSGPFHSSLMRPAAEKLAAVLAELTLSPASAPVIANVTAEPVTEAAAIRSLLERQVYSPVLWEDTVKRLIAEGVDTFVEIGSGSVLSGLVKKTDRSVRILTVNSMEAAEAGL